jgi:hypothetical protein
METALVRQPRGSQARPGAQRAMRVAIGVAGGALMAAAALLQPFAASHLLPARPANSHLASSRLAAASPPIAAPAATPVPVAVPVAATPAPRLVSPLAAAAPAASPEPTSAIPPAAPPSAPPGALGAPPMPRQSLSLQTDLLTPAAPAAAASPSAGKPATSGPHG